MKLLFKFNEPDMMAQDVTGLEQSELEETIAEWFVDTFTPEEDEVDPEEVVVEFYNSGVGAVTYEDWEVEFEIFGFEG
jgi:hypothetical protein